MTIKKVETFMTSWMPLGKMSVDELNKLFERIKLTHQSYGLTLIAVEESFQALMKLPDTKVEDLEVMNEHIEKIRNGWESLKSDMNNIQGELDFRKEYTEDEAKNKSL